VCPVPALATRRNFGKLCLSGFFRTDWMSVVGEGFGRAGKGRVRTGSWSRDSGTCSSLWPDVAVQPQQLQLLGELLHGFRKDSLVLMNLV